MFSLYFKFFFTLIVGVVSAFPFRGSPYSSNRVAYFLENDPAGNYIVSLKISEDGTLDTPVRTSTGGNGLSGLVVPSQDSVVVSDSVRMHSHLPNSTPFR
jgi:hypothetical protein